MGYDGELAPPAAPPPMIAAGVEVWGGGARAVLTSAVEDVGLSTVGDSAPEPEPEPVPVPVPDPDPKPAPPSNLPAKHCVINSASFAPVGVKLKT